MQQQEAKSGQDAKPGPDAAKQQARVRRPSSSGTNWAAARAQAREQRQMPHLVLEDGLQMNGLIPDHFRMLRVHLLADVQKHLDAESQIHDRFRPL